MGVMMERVAKAKEAIEARAGSPEVAMVLGSGLGGFADRFEDATVIPYSEIPWMPVSTVSGHSGNLVIGRISDKRVAAMQGRTHLYEGRSAEEVVFGTRLMAGLGAKTLIITNAAGGIDPSFAPGDLMLITDQLNLTGTSSLLGPNDEMLGPRFPDMTHAFDPALIADAERVAAKIDLSLRHGVYAGLLGPAYETPAEVRMLKTLGADAVGMSTVLEVLAARHMGLRVLGISCITNLAAGLSDAPLSHDEVTETAARARKHLEGLLLGVLEGIR